MATSTRYDIRAEQGSQYYNQIRLWNRDSAGNDTPYDLTNSSLRGQVRTQYDDATAYNFDLSIADAANGDIVIFIGADITATMPTGPLVYDIEVVDDLDPRNVIKPLWGNFFLRPEVTR